jgi:hypothetical protein
MISERVVGVKYVGSAALTEAPRRVCPEGWFLVLAVGLTFDNEFPRRALEPVDDGLSEERIGQSGQPFARVTVRG